MAIGNPFNGTLRGRLGESVFSRKAGAQHVRAYVQKPANPQSLRQLAQRVKFGTCSKFYQHGVQNLFKFAFEFKRQGQDDYNAFLQANIGNVPCNTRKAYNMGMPNLGRYVMSVGSLPALYVVWDGHDPDTNHAGIDIGRVSVPWAELTVGHLSSAIVSRYGLRDGDFITIAVVTSGAEPSQDLATAMERGGLTELNPDYRTEWKVYQFTLDSTSMVPASSLGIFSGLTGLGSLVTIADANEYNDPSSQGVCVMASRNTPRGVKVSTSRMVVNMVTAAAIEVGLSTEWTVFCAENFLAPGKSVLPYENILQGSIAQGGDAYAGLYRGELPVALVVREPLLDSKLPVWLLQHNLDFLQKVGFVVNGLTLTFEFTESDTGGARAIYSNEGTSATIGVLLSTGQVMGVTTNQGDKLEDIRLV